ncbi:MAG: flagellar basal body-associated protein FliL [Yokenella regensburgei]|jgi:flagellar FliL protein|uniref:Flagellar protein FliL n=1 Tax=Yokenella regensburgei TaxID=158877 RepID=A0AB38G199_9ENTR|nr:flagellar basal body-associated protein FliL [Yokenella regensburgei]EHM46073.1 flagellar basal body-associated protein FliL [Yokenella regensburgei ATCC 43003]KAF1367395.1 flagellar FliL protein [Yokenella regensburgei]KFD21537.1 FliL family flagellar biosynthesis protein [Yokenella regensburgei ATCC 49455]MDQ4428402.1 flagellar basal body-associated protein FliL [Yokenella regensburgei]MDR3105821.1 flagellar basal body-associated protein FliL [Yokenella regensburgei]
MTDSALSKKRKRSIWIPLLVLVTLAACATAGYSYWRLQQHPAASAKQEVPPPPAPVFYALDTFTVNLGDADRVLYVGITLRLKDEATRLRLSEYLPEVRSRLLLLFSRQNATDLATDTGKQKLVDAIKSTLAQPLVAGQPKQEVTDVLYTAFILR